MKRRIIITTSDLTVKQQQDITREFANRKWAYWHWLPSVWLIIVFDDSVSLHNLIAIVHAAAGSTVHCFVQVVGRVDDDWLTFGTEAGKDENASMSRWIINHWRA